MKVYQKFYLITEKQLAFANDAMDMRSTGKGSDPDVMIYDYLVLS